MPKPEPKTHGVSEVAIHFSLMEGERIVKAILLVGDWGPYWAVHQSEQDIIAARGKEFLPFNAGSGKGYVLKRLGLHERINTPEQIKEIEDALAAEKEARKDGSHRKHRPIMQDENQPAKKRGFNSASRSPRRKRQIRVSDF